jgi:Rubisco LSMT substrate-binding
MKKFDLLTLAMIPYFDYANYANPDNANTYVRLGTSVAANKAASENPSEAKQFLMFDDASVMEIVASRDISAGDELLFPYTTTNISLTNSQLLLQYGISMHTNEYEGVALDAGASLDPISDPLAAHRHHINKVNELQDRAIIRLKVDFPASFWQSLRVKELNQEDMKHLAVFKYEFKPENGYFSLQNELRVNIRVLSSIESLLDQYDTTLIQDLELLGNLTDGSRNLQHLPSLNAILYRVSIKRVLHAIILKSFINLKTVFSDLADKWTKDATEYKKRVEIEISKQVARDKLTASTTSAADPSVQSDSPACNAEGECREGSALRTSKSHGLIGQREADKELKDLESWLQEIGQWRSDVKKYETQWLEWVAAAVEPQWLSSQ